MTEPAKKSSKVKVRKWTEGDIPAIVECQKAAYAGFTADHLCDERNYRFQFSAFPEGQFLAEVDGRVVGYATSLIVQLDDDSPWYSYAEITGVGTFSTHTTQRRHALRRRHRRASRLPRHGHRRHALRASQAAADAVQSASHGGRRADTRLSRARRPADARAVRRGGEARRAQATGPVGPPQGRLPGARRALSAICATARA